MDYNILEVPMLRKLRISIALDFFRRHVATWHLRWPSRRRPDRPQPEPQRPGLIHRPRPPRNQIPYQSVTFAATAAFPTAASAWRWWRPVPTILETRKTHRARVGFLDRSLSA